MIPEKLLKVNFPKNVSIKEVKEIPEGETNEVYYCRGVLNEKDASFYLKVNKHPKIDLQNEDEVLRALQLYDFPAPRVLFSSHDGISFLALEEIQGTILWDLIDQKRAKYNPYKLEIYLFEYGKWLARIHQLPLKWQDQKRPKLYGFIGEEKENDPRFKKLVSWLDANIPSSCHNVFVHGDYNPASVVIDENEITGIIDWEFAGEGWKEYDLAWALRARQHFLNSQEERDMILKGYLSVGDYNPVSLRWCEVINYLHFAYWNKESNPEYMDFALNKAENLVRKVGFSISATIISAQA